VTTAREKTVEKKTENGGTGSALGGLASIAGAIGSSSTGSGAGSTENKIGAAVDLAKAASVSDEEIKSNSLQYRQFADKRAKIAPAGNKYAQRLARLTNKHRNEDGLSLNFKVILDPSVNANATADGSIRVYSGLMDLMNDQELLGVIGHEIGHVKLGHTLSKSRAALLASATRKAVASSSGKAGMLADSELGGFGEKLFNSQFSQSAETESDDYGLTFMKKHKYDVKAMESAFRKLAQETGKAGSVAQILRRTLNQANVRIACGRRQSSNQPDRRPFGHLRMHLATLGMVLPCGFVMAWGWQLFVRTSRRGEAVEGDARSHCKLQRVPWRSKCVVDVDCATWSARLRGHLRDGVITGHGILGQMCNRATSQLDGIARLILVEPPFAGIDQHTHLVVILRDGRVIAHADQTANNLSDAVQIGRELPCDAGQPTVRLPSNHQLGGTRQQARLLRLRSHQRSGRVLQDDYRIDLAVNP